MNVSTNRARKSSSVTSPTRKERSQASTTPWVSRGLFISARWISSTSRSSSSSRAAKRETRPRAPPSSIASSKFRWRFLFESRRRRNPTTGSSAFSCSWTSRIRTVSFSIISSVSISFTVAKMIASSRWSFGNGFSSHFFPRFLSPHL